MSFSPLYLATALISPACHAWACALDQMFGQKFQKEITFLISISKIIQFLIILPLAYWLQPTLAIPLTWIGLLMIVTLIEFAYVYPYFWALKHTDTSVVVALFSLGKIAVPALAWLFLGEQLALLQYVGFFVIILASFMLTFQWGHFRLNQAAWCMLAVSILLACEAILSKHILLQGATWESLTVWTMALEASLGAFLLALKPRKTIYLWRTAGRRVQGLFILEGLLSMVGNAGAMLALSLLPVSISKALGGTQHLFVLLYAKLFHPLWPTFFKEDSVHLSPKIKLAGLLLTCVGTLLAAGYLN